MATGDRRRVMQISDGTDRGDEEFRQVTEAMKKAAEAMIAATDSFRHQYNQNETTTDMLLGRNKDNRWNLNQDSGFRVESSDGDVSNSSNSNNNINDDDISDVKGYHHERDRVRENDNIRKRSSNKKSQNVVLQQGDITITEKHDQSSKQRYSSMAVDDIAIVRPMSVTTASRKSTGGSDSNGRTATTAMPTKSSTTSRNPYLVYRATRTNSRFPPATPIPMQTNIPTHIPMVDLFSKSGEGNYGHEEVENTPTFNMPHVVAASPSVKEDVRDKRRDDVAVRMSMSKLGTTEAPSAAYIPPYTPHNDSNISNNSNTRFSTSTIQDAATVRGSHDMRRHSQVPSVPFPLPSALSTLSPAPASSPHHVDLVEAALRLKHTFSYPGGSEEEPIGASDEKRRSKLRESVGTQATLGGGGFEPEPDPVLHIGRYTYIRSDAEAFFAYGSGGFIPREIRPPTLLPPAPAKKKSLGPYGFSLMHETLFVLIICLAQVLMLAGIAQALVPAQIMGQSFPDTEIGDLAWYSAAYSLTSGTFVLPAGRLGDLFGYKLIFIIGFGWFAAWSLIAGFAPYVQQAGAGGTIFFIISRALQGIGPAILVPNGQAMLGRAYPPGPRKNLVMCLFGAAAPVGFVSGAVMSSLFAQKTSWPWAFWSLAVVCVVLGVLSIPVLPRDTPPRPPTRHDEENEDEGVEVEVEMVEEDDPVTSKERGEQKTRRHQVKRVKSQQHQNMKKSTVPAKESLWVRMDAVGMLLGVSGLVLLNFAFNQAPIVGWTTPYTYFLLIIGVVFLVTFAHVETMQARYPLVPFAAMSATTNFVLGCTATGWGCFSVWVYYAICTIENGDRHWSPLLTSAAFAPAPISGLLASLLTGFLFSRHLRPHWVMLISMAAFFVGSLLFATAPRHQTIYWFNCFFGILIMPFGMDMSNPAAINLLSNSVGHENQGIAASLVVTFVNYAISLALGIAGSVEVGGRNGASKAADAAEQLFRGYRAAQYFGLGLGALGILLASAFLFQQFWHERSVRRLEQPRSRPGEF